MQLAMLDRVSGVRYLICFMYRMPRVMVSRWLPNALVLLVLLLLSGCLPKVIKRRIAPEWVGTPKARLSGYFGSGRTWKESVPGAVRHDTVLDEATLAVTDRDQTCIDVVIRTKSRADEPLDQLDPRIIIGDQKETPIVSNETVGVHDYSFEGSQEVFSLAGVAVGDFVGLSLEKPAEKVFRVIERRGRYCVPIPATAPVRLVLRNSRLALVNADYVLRFEWSTR